MFESSNASRSNLLGRTVIIALTVVLLTLLGFVHFKWWPWLMGELKTVQVVEKSATNLRLYCTISDEISRIWAPHATALLAFEKDNLNLQPNENNMGNLLTLPGVKDAFYLNLQNSNVFVINKIVPDDLLLKLDLRGKKHCGGRSQMMRRLVGGLTRFEHIKIDQKRFPLMVRYVGTYYPTEANEVIGLVLDEDWFINQIPARLDSLAKNSNNLLFMAPEPADTQWFKDDDPYRDFWKQTIGVLHGSDTLWWYGDRNTEIYHYTQAKNKEDLDYGYVVPVPDFNLKFLIKVEFPLNTKKVIAGIKSVRIVFPLIEIVGIILVIVLISSIYLTTRQASRNQIALAHLAHAIKTPVARIRLDTDSLLEEMVASPNEEREIITAISRECGRMERAVQSAALSLEEGKRTLNLVSGDLSKIVTDTAQAWQPQFNQVGIKLEINSTAEELSGRFDSEMITIMIDNLLDNALRHTMLNLENTGQSALVSVKLKKSGEKAEITIDDMGSGIPKSERKHIFKRFQRVRGDAASGVSGLGLGLALVKEIAEGHGGNVSVKDNDKHGARFVVELPIEV